MSGSDNSLLPIPGNRIVTSIGPRWIWVFWHFS